MYFQERHIAMGQKTVPWLDIFFSLSDFLLNIEPDPEGKELGGMNSLSEIYMQQKI